MLLGAARRRRRRADRAGHGPRRGLRPARRAASAARTPPPAVLISRRFDIPWEAGLFAAARPAGRDLRPGRRGLGAGRGRAGRGRAAPGRARRPPRSADLRARGVRALLSEGGPTLFRGLLATGLVDELFLTLTPLLTGDAAEIGILAGLRLADPARFALSWALRSERRTIPALRERPLALRRWSGGWRSCLRSFLVLPASARAADVSADGRTAALHRRAGKGQQRERSTSRRRPGRRHGRRRITGDDDTFRTVTGCMLGVAPTVVTCTDVTKRRDRRRRHERPHHGVRRRRRQQPHPSASTTIPVIDQRRRRQRRARRRRPQRQHRRRRGRRRRSTASPATTRCAAATATTILQPNTGTDTMVGGDGDRHRDVRPARLAGVLARRRCANDGRRPARTT